MWESDPSATPPAVVSPSESDKLDQGTVEVQREEADPISAAAGEDAEPISAAAGEAAQNLSTADTDPARGDPTAATPERVLGPTGRELPDFPEPPPVERHGPARVIALCNQ